MRAELFAGNLMRFGQSLLVDDDPRPVITVPELLLPATLDRLLLRVYGPDLMPSQLPVPVLVSQWSKYYFMLIIPPVVVAGLVHNWRGALALDQVAFALDERGVLEGVRFSGADGVDESVDPFGRFGPLLDHLQQVIEVLSTYGGVAPGVLWGNAGDYLETCLTQLAQVSDVSLNAGLALLRERTRPDGRRNPLFNAITYREGPNGLRRQRRSCCLSHRVEWVGRCEHCPLEPGG